MEKKRKLLAKERRPAASLSNNKLAILMRVTTSARTRKETWD